MNGLPCAPESIVESVDYCLATHLHFDHFSPRGLPKSMSIIVQNEQDKKAVQAMGFASARCFTGNELALKDVTIHKTKAVHGENEAAAKAMGEVCGLVLEAAGEKTLYLASDTVYCGDVERAIDKYQPAVIVLNCCAAAIPSGRLIMDFDDVAKVCARAPNSLVIASHLDSVNHALLSSDDIRRLSKERNLSQVIAPANGEKVQA